MRALLMAGAVALLATACKPAPEAQSAPSAAPAPAATVAMAAAPATVAAAAPAPVAEAAPTHLRGKGLMGKDGFGLTLCGEETQRIAVLEPEAQSLLDGYLAGGAHTFAFEGWGDLVGSDKVHVTAFERVAGDVGGCDERSGGFAFRAHGSPPLWSLEVDAGAMTLTRPGKPALSGPAKELGEDHGIRTFEAATAKGKLTARLSPAHCNDRMSHAMSGWRAEVTLGAEKFDGCAFAGEPAPLR